MSAAENNRILLVEDDQNFGDVLRSYLEMHDYDITLATDGEMGLQKFNDGKYDEAMGKVTPMFKKLKAKAKDQGGKFRDEIADLNQEQKNLEKEIASVDKNDEKEKKRLGERFGKLLDRLDELSDKIDNSK